MSSKKLLNEFFNNFAVSLLNEGNTKMTSLTVSDLKKELKEAVEKQDIQQISMLVGFFVFIKNEDFCLNNIEHLDDTVADSFEIFKEEFIENNELLNKSEKTFLELLLTNEFFWG